jgi:hypothetical protein
MAGSRQPGPLDGRRDRVNVKDGTLPLQASPIPKPTGSVLTARPKRTIKVLALDGAKVHDFLFHVALAEVRWEDLNTDPSGDAQPLVQKHKALDLAAKLYDLFLAASAKGSTQAKAFLADQGTRQKKLLQESQSILHAQQVKLAAREEVLSEVAFGAQAVKSAATVGVAVIGCFLTGPAIISGALIGLGFDVIMEGIKDVGNAQESGPNTVVIGFPQTVANDAVSVAGSVQQVSAEATRDALAKTLSYPLKSSVYRFASLTSDQLNGLLRGLGVLSTGVAIYQEIGPVMGSVEQMQSARTYYDSLQSSGSGTP